jgi:hypothetical protein
MGFDYCILKRLKSSKNSKPMSFVIAIILHVSVSFDHHQMCINKAINILHFLLNYIFKMDQFFQRHRLKTVCVFWD